MGWSEEEGCPARSAGGPSLTARVAGCLRRGQSTVIHGQVRTVVVGPELENTSVCFVSDPSSQRDGID